MATQAELELVISMRDRAQAQIRGLERQLAGLGRTVQTVGRAFNGGGGFLGGAGLAAATASVVGIGLAFDSTEEQARLAFETILGSGAKAQDMIDRVKKVALETPFAFTDVLRSSQRLLAAGFDPDQVDKTMATIADAISSTGDISRDKLDQMTGAFARMRMTGIFSMEAISELGASGVNVLHLLAEASGQTDSGMQRTLEHMSGRMPAGPMMERIFGVLQARFGGLAAKEADTMAGVLNNIRDLLQQRLGAIMLPIFIRTEQLLRRIFYYLDQVREVFKKLPAPVKEAVKEWAPWIVLVAAALVVLPPLIALITSLSTGFVIVGGAVLAAVAFLTPFGPALALIAIAAATLYLAWRNNWLGIRDVLTDVYGRIMGILGPFQTWLSTFFDDPLGHALDVLRFAADGWLMIVGTSTAQIGSDLATGWGYVVTLFQWLRDTVGPIIAGAWGYVASVFQWLVDTVSGILYGGWTYVAGLFQWVSDTAGSIIRGGWEYVVALFQWLRDTVGGIWSGGAQWIANIFTWVRDVGADAFSWMTQRVVDLVVWMRDQILAIVVPAWTAVASVFTWLRDTGAAAIEWLVDRVVSLFRWMGDRVRDIWGPIGNIIGRVVNVGGGTASSQSAMVASASSGGSSSGGGGYTININGPVYAQDIEDLIVKALDAARRRGRTG